MSRKSQLWRVLLARKSRKHENAVVQEMHFDSQMKRSVHMIFLSRWKVMTSRHKKDPKKLTRLVMFVAIRSVANVLKGALEVNISVDHEGQFPNEL